MIILNEKRLYDILHEYIFEYYNVSRTHMSLGKDSPVHRPIQKDGKIIEQIVKQGGEVYADFDRFAKVDTSTKIISR